MSEHINTINGFACGVHAFDMLRVSCCTYISMCRFTCRSKPKPV